MSLPPPLFTTPGSVYRRHPHTYREDDHLDEVTVDASLPSTPVIEVPETGPSSFRSFGKQEPSDILQQTNRVDGLEGYGRDQVKEEDPLVKEESATPLRELDPNEFDERQCRICFGGLDDEQTLGRLISPCLCSGSMRVGLWFSLTLALGTRS